MLNIERTLSPILDNVRTLSPMMDIESVPALASVALMLILITFTVSTVRWALILPLI